MFTPSSNLFFAFFVPFLVGIILIPLLICFSSQNKKMVDVAEGDELKIHKKPTSLLGGVGMVLAMVVGLVLFLGKNSFGECTAIVLGILVIGGLGFWDDVKWKHVTTIKPKLKFALLLICTLVPGILLALAQIGFNFLPIFIISALLSFIYIFVVINAVNYQDGMDGLAGGLVVISLAGFLVLGLATGNYVMVSIALIGMGAVLSFLIFNFPPAKVFMGDSGAYSLGFLLATLAMMFSKPYDFPSVIAPIFIIGLPVFDGVFTNVRRLINGKSIFLGNRSHFYDKLMQRGFSVKKTLAICYALQIVLVMVGLIAYKI